MKDKYESPKAEKLEFNYTEAVTASGTGAPQANSEAGEPVQVWVGDDHFPSATNCAKQWTKQC